MVGASRINLSYYSCNRQTFHLNMFQRFVRPYKLNLSNELYIFKSSESTTNISFKSFRLFLGTLNLVPHQFLIHHAAFVLRLMSMHNISVIPFALFTAFVLGFLFFFKYSQFLVRYTVNKY